MIELGIITILSRKESTHIAANIMAQAIKIQWLEEVVQGYIRIVDTATDALVGMECECDSYEGQCARCRGMQDVQAVLSEHFEVVIDGAA